MTIKQELQKASIGALVELYQLDLTMFGEGHLYLTPITLGGTGYVQFGGQTYIPLPITSEGWTTVTGGAPPRPTLKISNVSRFIQPYLNDYSDLVGSIVTRNITLDKFLDTSSSPDSSQLLSSYKYVIQQKRKVTRLEVEFVLSSLPDAPNFKLPKGFVLHSEYPAAGLFRKQ